MIYPNQERVKQLREEDRHGRKSNNDIEREVTFEALEAEFDKIEDDRVRNILETLVFLVRR